MAECIVCGSFTKSNYDYCYECYCMEIFDWNKFEQLKGLNDKEWNYRFNMIKGRIAETLVQELFLTSDYKVFQYWMENSIPDIVGCVKGIKARRFLTLETCQIWW